MRQFIIAIGTTLVILTGASLYILDDRRFQDEKFIFAATRFVDSGHQDVDIYEPIDIWTRLAKEKHAFSQCFLGYLYKKGFTNVGHTPWQQVAINNDKAERWLKIAEKNGCMLAQYLLGMLYVEKTKVNPEHLDKAIYWLEIVSNHGYDYAQYHLGILLLTQNKLQAETWFLRSAKQGHKPAIKELQKHYKHYENIQIIEPIYENDMSRPDIDFNDTGIFTILQIMVAKIEAHSNSPN